MITLFTNGHPLQEIGIKSLVGYLEFHKIPIRAIYLNKCNKLSEQAIKKIMEIIAGSSLVGFSLMSKDLNILLPLINAIKKQNIPVVAGGVHPTALPKESLEFADFVCVGEGEEPLRLLCEALINKTNNFNIPNIGYKADGKIIINPITYFNGSLDTLPFPDYVFKDSYILTNGKDEIKKIPTQPEEKSKFFAGRNSFLFYSQRGCNFSCTYCSNSLYHKLTQGSNHKWHRNTSPQRVKEELRSHLRNMPFITHIAINDDNFLIRDIQEIEDIAGFLKNELNKSFTVNATPPFVTEEKIALLVKFGLKGISFGVQSGSERILRDIYKRFVKNEQVLMASKIISKFANQGLSADYGFILDNPYENEDDWRDSLRLWISLSQPKTLSLYSLEFFPGTELTKRAISDGYLKSASSEFNKDYRRDIKYSYANSLFFLNIITIPKWLNNLLMSDLMVKLWIGAPVRFVIKNRYPAELFFRAVNKIKYLSKKYKPRMTLNLKVFLVKTRRTLGLDFITRKINDWYEKSLNHKLKQEAGARKIMTGWSIIVVTDGKSNQLLENLIKSVDSELKETPSEIIIVGPKNIKLSYGPKVELRYVFYKELGLWCPGLITLKKNLGAMFSKYDKLVVCHDYIHFEPGWKKGFDRFGDDFDICVNKILNLDGVRNRDWITWDYPGIGVGLLPYHAECTKYQIISGAYFVIKRKFFAENLLNEKLRWGEGEDVEWSKRIRNKTTFKFNPYSTVSFSKIKKSLPKNWQEGTRLLEKEFPVTAIQKNFMSPNSHGSILAVNEQKWLDAQEFERRCWVVSNQNNTRLQIVMKFLRALKNHPRHFWQLLKFRDFYAGDDWNFWWKDQFSNYQALPVQIGKALEVGCGPYTNLRLIAKLKTIDEIHCLDPLINLYLNFKHNWLATMAKKAKIFTYLSQTEVLPFADKAFDLVVCNNVLDHVQDTAACMAEMKRVLKPGGYFVFGQDLSNDQDIVKQRQEDKGYVGHPIKLHHQALDSLLDDFYDVKMKKILPREAGRNPRHHYGTYIFVGIKN